MKDVRTDTVEDLIKDLFLDVDNNQDMVIENICDIINKYDYYVSTYYNLHDEGSTPVCFMEWYNNDYLES